VDDEIVEAAARALAVAHDADACFDPLEADADGYISEDAREAWENGAEDREFFRKGARAALTAQPVVSVERVVAMLELHPKPFVEVGSVMREIRKMAVQPG
jgi:hypothetical protein